jgi:aspartyl-tRNA(Asn)/glutamyl-tRNA(Gln) amidotransferase subunit C
VAVSESDVRHVASLARLAIDPARLASLARELNGILEHMEVLAAVETAPEMWDVRSETTATALRSDVDGTPIPLAAPRESFAPLMRDGFFLVPRLATHEDQGERAP